jgi:hypothetical protein
MPFTIPLIPMTLPFVNASSTAAHPIRRPQIAEKRNVSIELSTVNSSKRLKER